ncbi:MAG: hypothetical protein COA78_31095 [Blastopirellula sp.]|nr:MAG: hypothetical protein COA78_31095 [Blastopirellula sp.]
MATVVETSPGLHELIGETAGKIWHQLNEHGPSSMPKLIKAIDCPRDQVLLATGWLAREEKLTFSDQGRSKIVALKEIV